jgi:hypothetical protein
MVSKSQVIDINRLFSESCKLFKYQARSIRQATKTFANCVLSNISKAARMLNPFVEGARKHAHGRVS